MYILVYIDKENNREDVVQDEEGNTTFFWLVDVRKLKAQMVENGFDPEDYRIAHLTFIE